MHLKELSFFDRCLFCWWGVMGLFTPRVWPSPTPRSLAPAPTPGKWTESFSRACPVRTLPPQPTSATPYSALSRLGPPTGKLSNQSCDIFVFSVCGSVSALWLVTLAGSESPHRGWAFNHALVSHLVTCFKFKERSLKLYFFQGYFFNFCHHHTL